MMPPSSKTWTLVAWAFLALVGGHLFAVSYDAWGDPIIDLGRDLWVPSQLLDGRVLYRDVLYNYGPVVPYLLAAVVALFGNALRVFAAFGAMVGLATLAASWAIGRRIAGLAGAFAAALLFLVLCFFANSTWGCNFVLPYAFAATAGTAFSLGSFLFLLRHLERRDRASLAWSVALLVAAVFSKQEVGLGIAAVHAVAWWSHRLGRRAIVTTLVAGVLAGGLFVAVFAARAPGEHALFAENLLKFAAEPDPFFAVVAGFVRPGEQLVRVATATGKLALIVLLGGFGGLAPGLWKRPETVKALLAVLALAACAAAIWAWADVRLMQATPLLALAAIATALIRDREDPLLLLAVYALVSGLRVLLEFHPLWYGFYLAVPAFPFLVLLASRVAARLPARRTAAATLAGLALVICWRFEAGVRRAYAAKTDVLATSKGALRDLPTGRAEAIGQFLAWAASRPGAPRPSMVVLPEGVSLNVFTGFPNPTAYYLFTPPEIPTPEVERRMIRELDATKPDFLVITSRDLAEFGRRGIGLDYALALGDWIRASYDLDRVFEAGRPPWRLLLLRRRGISLASEELLP